MKRHNAVAFLLLGCLAAGAMGCAVADTGAFGRLQDEMVVLRKEVAALKSGSSPAAPGGGGGGEIQSLRKTVADLGADSDRLRTDLLATSSRVDETRSEMKRVADRQAEQEKALQDARKSADRVGEIDRRVAALEEKMGKAAAPAAAGAGAETPPGWKSPEEMYEYAVGQVKGGNPKKGRDTLSAFVTQHPGHKLVPNALYWKGESFYVEKDYENAILSFQDVVDKYPGGDKAPDAVFKQGISFLALNDKKNARILLDLVIAKYPRSSAAEMAKKKLPEIK